MPPIIASKIFNAPCLINSSVRCAFVKHCLTRLCLLLDSFYHTASCFARNKKGTLSSGFLFLMLSSTKCDKNAIFG